MARIRHGMPGIYNATPITLADQEGAALAVDSSGRLILPGAATGGAAAPTTTDIVGGVYNTSAPTYTNGQATQNQSDVNGNQQIVGNVSAAATDSGNPVKVGGKFNTTLPTYTDGQRGDIQLGTRGSVSTTLYAVNNTNAITSDSQSGDAQAGNLALSVQNRGQVYNGATWDRVRSGGITGMAGVTPQATPSGGASFLNIVAGQATTVVKASAGTLYAIVLNSAATATNTTIVYDHPSGVGTVIGRPAATTATVPTTLNYGPTGLACANGITIITATANGSDMTVIYK